MTVAPDARLDDGKFDVRVFRHFSKFELLRHLASIAFGRRRYSPHVRRTARRRVGSWSSSPAADVARIRTTWGRRRSSAACAAQPAGDRWARLCGWAGRSRDRAGRGRRTRAGAPSARRPSPPCRARLDLVPDIAGRALALSMILKVRCARSSRRSARSDRPMRRFIVPRADGVRLPGRRGRAVVVPVAVAVPGRRGCRCRSGCRCRVRRAWAGGVRCPRRQVADVVARRSAITVARAVVAVVGVVGDRVGDCLRPLLPLVADRPSRPAGCT